MRIRISELKEQAKTVLPEKKEERIRPLIEVIQEQGCIDIAGNIFDWGIAFDCACQIKDIHDGYDMFMYFIGREVNCLKFQPNWYSLCDVEKFIKKYISVFKKFFNEKNREGYRPMDYEDADNEERDLGFYEAYLQPLESLIAGNYIEDDYLELSKSLMNLKLILDKKKE